MQRSILLIFCLFCLVTSVSGYQIYIDCPDQVTVGAPVKCAIDSNFPADTEFNLEFSTATQLVSYQTVTVMDSQKTQYKFFETLGLPEGKYSISVRISDSDTKRLSSDSIITDTVIIKTTQIPAITVTTHNRVTVTSTPVPTLTTIATTERTPEIPTSTIIITPIKTTQPLTIIPTVTITAAPTKSVQELLTEQNQKIDEQNRLIAEQNTKLESQNDLLTQFLSKFKNIFGWN